MVATRTSNIAEKDFHRFSPFRQPDSLWTRATELFSEGKPPASWEDPAIRLALNYQRAMDAANSDRKRQAVDRRMPNVAGAHAIHVEAGPTRDEIEARLLAGQSFSTIASKVGISEQAIETYEKLFFSVSDALDATDFLMVEAIGIHVGMRRSPTRGEIWKYMALAGGPLVVDLLVAEYFGRDEPQIQDRKLLAQKAHFLVWECTRGSSLGDTAAVLEGYHALFLQARSSGDEGERQDEMERLIERLKMQVDLWASAAAGRETEERKNRRTNRQQRTADKETIHGRDQDQTKDENPFAEFTTEGSPNVATEPCG